jgi:phosphatidylserine decarboxylase
MIAREGLPFIFIGLVLTVLCILGASRWDSRVLLVGSIVLGILTLFTTFFFRDPDRQFEPAPGLLVAPADGTILRVDTLETHPFVGGRTIKVSIFLSIFNVHVNRVPSSGKIDYVKYNPGKFFAAFEDKASELNEQTEIGMTTESGQKIMFKQIAGLIARRIVCKLQPEEQVSTGERFGLIRFGSRTELFVPADSRICVKPGDKIKGGQSVIGYLATPDSKQTSVTTSRKGERE